MATLHISFALALYSCLVKALPTALQLGKRSKSMSNQKIPLPEVSEISKGSLNVMNEMSTQVNTLQNRLTEVHQKGQDALRQLKADYEQQLAHQRDENVLLQTQNKDTSDQIQVIRASSAAWRKEAEALERSCKMRKEELLRLQANMTIAQEFMQQTMSTTAQMLGAEELKVLQELSAADELRQKDESHRHALGDIAGEDKNIAMLELNSGLAVSPEDMLRTLMSSIDELSKQQNASATVMKATFDEAFKKGTDARALLLNEQAKLNATRASELALSQRLHQAADHLTKTNTELGKKLSALRNFHARLGGATQKPVSLLQIAQKILPDMSTLVKEPEQVFKGLTSKVSALEAGVSEKEQEGKTSLEQLKANFEDQLNRQSNTNNKMKSNNQQLALRVEDLNKENLGLRKQAQALKGEVGKLEADLKTLRSNISTAQEFAALALKSSKEMLDNHTKLKVLLDLDSQEAEVLKNRMHEESLQKVASTFLQVSATSAKGIEKPKELLESLAASLKALKEEQAASEVSLKASFEQEFSAGAQRYKNLAEEQATLNATIADAEVLRNKLRKAVSHLKATRDELLERSQSLRLFAKKLSADGNGHDLQ